VPFEGLGQGQVAGGMGGGGVGAHPVRGHHVPEMGGGVPQPLRVELAGGAEQDRLTTGHRLGRQVRGRGRDHLDVPDADGAGRQGRGAGSQVVGQPAGRPHPRRRRARGQPGPVSQPGRGRRRPGGRGPTAPVEGHQPAGELRLQPVAGDAQRHHVLAQGGDRQPSELLAGQLVQCTAEPAHRRSSVVLEHVFYCSRRLRQFSRCCGQDEHGFGNCTRRF